MKTWTKALCLSVCAGLLISGVAAGLRGDPQDDLKKMKDDAKKQMDTEKKKLMQPGGDKKPATGQPAADPMAAMILEASKPVAQHDIIKNFAGTWKTEMKMWEPGATEPTLSTGMMKGTMIHGGRYLQGEFTGDYKKIPFTGSLTWGYNRVENRYESTWCDNFDTGIMMSTGQPTADGNTINSTGTFKMAMPDGTLMNITQREIMTMVDKNTYHEEMWHKAGDQPETKAMDITYTRTGDAPKPAAVTLPAGITMPPATH